VDATVTAERAAVDGGWWRSSLHAWAEREGERVWQGAQMSEGRWASRARGLKGARTRGRGRRMHGHGRVHGGEIVGERLGTADRWGRWDRERGRGGKERRRQLGPTEHREGEGGSTHWLAPTGGARLSGTEGARAGWA
jgi:hypothetical protein